MYTVDALMTGILRRVMSCIFIISYIFAPSYVISQTALDGIPSKPLVFFCRDSDILRLTAT